MRIQLPPLARGTLSVLAGCMVLLSACGTEPAERGANASGADSTADPTDSTGPISPAAGDQPMYVATATVLEEPAGGPRLCLGGVLESLPPQCDGPGITNWDWERVDDELTESGTTWGEYTVVVTYDGTDVTLAETPRDPEPPDPVPGDEPAAGPEPTTPCEAPAGGWEVEAADRATDEALTRAFDYAANQPDYAGGWVDQSINPALADADPATEKAKAAANDPTKLVLNLAFTGDLTAHEAEVRQLWGGALCVSEADHSESELRRILDEIAAEPDFLGGGIDVYTNSVHASVIVEDEHTERYADTYGADVVRVDAALRPYTE